MKIFKVSREKKIGIGVQSSGKPNVIVRKLEDRNFDLDINFLIPDIEGVEGKPSSSLQD